MTENPFAAKRGKLDVDDPRNILADHNGPITDEVIKKYNSAKWGVNGSGPFIADQHDHGA